jgi:hypothetical protein
MSETSATPDKRDPATTSLDGPGPVGSESQVQLDWEVASVGDEFDEDGVSAEGWWEDDGEGGKFRFEPQNSPAVYIGPADFAAARTRRDRLNRELAALPPDEAAERIVQESINRNSMLRKILEMRHESRWISNEARSLG